MKERNMNNEVGMNTYGPGGLDTRRGVLTVEQTAERIGISPRTVRRLVADKKIKHLKIGRLVRIYSPDLDEFVEHCTVEVAA
jgi:excisionase family DNA binding protein